MENIKDILHELRCDIACIPRTEDNKEEIKNTTQTLQKAWELVKESDSLPCVRLSLLEQAKECLMELCQLKSYKDDMGKDAHYQKRQPELWKEANRLLKELSS